MTFDVREIDLARLDSATKYPSIPTYHMINGRDGVLLDDVVTFAGEVHGSEKVDGTCARIILLPDGTYIIGSREELLHGKGDLIANSSLGVVDALRGIADGLKAPGDQIVVYYGEVYGHGIGGRVAKQYTHTGRVGFRLFDIVTIANYREVLGWPRERIASWRDHGGQEFEPVAFVEIGATLAGMETVPRLFTIVASNLPTSHDGMTAFLAEHAPTTLVALDDTVGKPEGIVLRASDRSVIAKVRYEDYQRTLRKKTANLGGATRHLPAGGAAAEAFAASRAAGRDRVESAARALIPGLRDL